MTESSKEMDSTEPRWFRRRSYIVSLSSGIGGLLAGCGRKTGDSGQEGQNEISGQSTEESKPQEVIEVEEKIDRVFELITSYHIADGQEFVFEVENFQKEVDRKDMVSMAREAREAAEALDADAVHSTARRGDLTREARIAFLLVDQRILLYEAITSGVVYGRAFDQGEYSRGVDAVKVGSDSLEMLLANGGELKNALNTHGRRDVDFAKTSHDMIRTDLDVLLNVLRWTFPVYEGFQQAAEGMVAVMNGNRHLEEERYGSAREKYHEAREHFSSAETSFDSAHGTGTTVEYVTPIVEDLRCLIPVLEDGYHELDSAFEELEAGNEKQGLQDARGTLMEMDKEFNKCL